MVCPDDGQHALDQRPGQSGALELARIDVLVQQEHAQNVLRYDVYNRATGKGAREDAAPAQTRVRFFDEAVLHIDSALDHFVGLYFCRVGRVERMDNGRATAKAIALVRDWILHRYDFAAHRIDTSDIRVKTVLTTHLKIESARQHLESRIALHRAHGLDLAARVKDGQRHLSTDDSGYWNVFVSMAPDAHSASAHRSHHQLDRLVFELFPALFDLG